MAVLSPKIRVALTAAATILAALVPVLPVGSDVQVALGGTVALLAAIGIIPAHLEVEGK